MGRKLYSHDYWGNLSRDRKAERKRDGVSLVPGARFVMVLVVLALILVIASVL